MRDPHDIRDLLAYQLISGAVSANAEPFDRESRSTLIERLESVWRVLDSKGIDRDLLISRSLLSPATCCLVNEDKEKTVEKAFDLVNRMSAILREKYKLID